MASPARFTPRAFVVPGRRLPPDIARRPPKSPVNRRLLEPERSGTGLTAEAHLAKVPPGTFGISPPPRRAGHCGALPHPGPSSLSIRQALRGRRCRCLLSRASGLAVTEPPGRGGLPSLGSWVLHTGHCSPPPKRPINLAGPVTRCQHAPFLPLLCQPKSLRSRGYLWSPLDFPLWAEQVALPANHLPPNCIAALGSMDPQTRALNL